MQNLETIVLGIGVVVGISIALTAVFYAIVKAMKVETLVYKSKRSTDDVLDTVIRDMRSNEDQVYRDMKNELRSVHDQMREDKTDIYAELASMEIKIGKRSDELNRRLDELSNEVWSQLDSRLDKLENKLTNKK